MIRPLWASHRREERYGQTGAETAAFPAPDHGRVSGGARGEHEGREEAGRRRCHGATEPAGCGEGANCAELRRQLPIGDTSARSAPSTLHTESTNDEQRNQLQDQKISNFDIEKQGNLPNARCDFLFHCNTVFMLMCHTGVVVRCIGIAPEKALKMAAWDGGINFINYAYPQCSKGLQWTFGGAMAGVGTTILGEKL